MNLGRTDMIPHSLNFITILIIINGFHTTYYHVIIIPTNIYQQRFKIIQTLLYKQAVFSVSDTLKGVEHFAHAHMYSLIFLKVE